MSAAPALQVCSLVRSLLPYAPVLALQEELVALRKQDRLRDTLLLLQELQQKGTSIVSIPRGGETTFHGPGQLVAYPIVGLRQLKVGARAYVEGLEDAMVRTLGCFGLQAHGRVPGRTGVWVGERKIGAVGVRITHGITSHGVALNVCTDLAYFDAIVPCAARRQRDDIHCL